MKSNLCSTLTSQLLSIEKLKKWDADLYLAADGYLYTYPFLEEEIIVRNCYIRCFVETKEVLDYDLSNVIAIECLNRLLKADVNNVSSKFVSYICQAVQNCVSIYPKKIVANITEKHTSMLFTLLVNSNTKALSRIHVLRLLYLLSGNMSLQFTALDCHRMFVLCYSNLLNLDENNLILNLFYNLLSQSNGE